MRYNAWLLARAWNSVALAQSEDAGRPALYRSTLIESYPTGVRLVSTDGYILLKAWVPYLDSPDEAEPGQDQLPEETAICADTDRRVIKLMRYAQDLSRKDGEDTDIVMTMGLGAEREGEQGTLDGMTRATVEFRLDHVYDESIETPVHDGAFPQWRSLWFSHVWQATGLVTFGASGILRLGKLSALWDHAAIRFELGGASGVSKVTIQGGHGINVSGLAMPMRDSVEDLSADAEVTPLPPSVEGIDHEFGDALDQFLADVMRDEQAGQADDAVVTAGRLAQMIRAGEAIVRTYDTSVAFVVSVLEVTTERATEVLAELEQAGLLVLVDGQDAAAGEVKYLIGAHAEQLLADWTTDAAPFDQDEIDPGDPPDEAV